MATPNQKLVAAAKAALVLLDPDWRQAQALRAALSALAPKPPKNACPICNDRITNDSQPWLAKNLKPAYAHNLCVARYQAEATAFAAWCDAQRERDSRKLAFDAAAAERCACGHRASAHEADDLENLLQCRSCDCDHFHYVVAEAA